MWLGGQIAKLFWIIHMSHNLWLEYYESWVNIEQVDDAVYYLTNQSDIQILIMVTADSAKVNEFFKSSRFQVEELHGPWFMDWHLATIKISIIQVHFIKQLIKYSLIWLNGQFISQ